jgi:hypothetical protein
MPKPTRVTCYVCRAQLGSVLDDQLIVWGHEVRYGPRGALIIVCSSCQTERRWEQRKAS